MTTYGSGLLARLGLGRSELRAWALYDWANSAFVTVVVTTVFPIYFARTLCVGVPETLATQRFLVATTAGMVVAALIAPYLGALADCSGRTKRLLGASLAVALATTLGLAFAGPGAWLAGAVLFALANVAASSSFVFYDALLPHVARDDEVDRVSAAGYALGYVGGAVMLGVSLALVLADSLEPALGDASSRTRIGFAAVALWWALFSVPLFRRVPEPPRTSVPAGSTPWREALRRLAGTYGELRRHPQALRMLVAFLLFNDGIGTIIRVATIYGAERNLPEGHLIGAILLVQVVGVPFSFAFGWLADRIGAKRCVLLGIAVYFVISGLAFFMETTAHFYALAFLVATVQGGTQALARSLFASLIPRERTAEFFGFFGVAERFAGVLGPPTFALGAWIGGASRWGVLGVVPFFALGALVLARVDVARGRAEARTA